MKSIQDWNELFEKQRKLTYRMYASVIAVVASVAIVAIVQTFTVVLFCLFPAVMALLYYGGAKDEVDRVLDRAFVDLGDLAAIWSNEPQTWY